MLKTLANKRSCPICKGTLLPKGQEYTIEELFELWKPIEFSRKVIEEHREQAEATRAFLCSSCRLEIFLPQIIGTPSFYIEAYNLASNQKASTFTYSDNKWEFGEAIADAAGSHRIFEFGSGNGEFLVRMGKHAIEVAGSEYNSKAIATARSKGVRVFGPSDDPREFENSCDAVFSFHVLEHAADPVNFADRMIKMAKPGAMIGIAVPNQDGPIRFIEPCVMNMPPHHATRWRLSSLQALASRLGLTIERIAYEPLLLENHSYYSVHWVKYILSIHKWTAGRAQFAMSVPLRLIMGGLHRMGLKYIKKIKGQSIYILMRKPSA
ncbi:MAG: class I SAM-dependent methyltransferase [Desulfobacterales bacterium]|nr:class I SAM-dependent methyltransferase [Desulfobacterales bacterium]